MRYLLRHCCKWGFEYSLSTRIFDNQTARRIQELPRIYLTPLISASPWSCPDVARSASDGLLSSELSKHFVWSPRLLWLWHKNCVDGSSSSSLLPNLPSFCTCFYNNTSVLLMHALAQSMSFPHSDIKYLLEDGKRVVLSPIIRQYCPNDTAAVLQLLDSAGRWYIAGSRHLRATACH